jgi:hypothetical protein
LWTLLAFVGVQAGLTFLADRRQPELRYPEMGYRLARLRARVAEDPSRPLMLALGSSRTEMGVSPGNLMLDPTPEGKVPLAFNFGLIQADPVTELVVFRTLLRDGIRPTWLILEVMPPFLSKTDEALEDEWNNSVARYGWHDMGVLRRYCPKALDLCVRWCKAQLKAETVNRTAILARYAPSWLPADAQPSYWYAPDPWGWLQYPGNVPPEQYRQNIARTRAEYLPHLAAFHICPIPDHALREVLALCRREGIRPVLLLMPEAADFRSLYSPPVAAQLDAYLARLSREYRAPIADGRAWVPDSGFTDGHHLVVSGAVTFTDRLYREIVRPLLVHADRAMPRGSVVAAPTAHAEGDGPTE